MKRSSVLFIFLTTCIFSTLHAQGPKGAYRNFKPNFINSVATAPNAVTSAATTVGATVATLHGTVDPMGTSTSGWFQWGISPTLTDSTAKQNMGSGNGAVSLNKTLTSLIPNTTYAFRAAANNIDGSSFGTTLQFTTLPFTRDSAIARVISQVINPSAYKNTLVAFLYDPPGSDSTLTSGYTLTTVESTAVYPVSGSQWFFWIDLTGDIRFAHPCQFVLVDGVTASIQVYNVDWWPVIKPPSLSPFQKWSTIEERYKDSTSIIYGNYTGTPEPPYAVPKHQRGNLMNDQLNRLILFKTTGALSGNTCGILVGGAAGSKGETNAWQNDLDSIKTALTTPAPGGGSAMTSEVQVKNNASKDDIQKMIDTTVAHNCNSIIFYYSGHGMRANGGGLFLTDGKLSYTVLATMLNKGGGLKFKDLILDNCFGGISIPSFTSKPIPVTILTAADSTKTSSGSVTFIDKNGDGKLNDGDSITTGQGAYTESWMKCWRKLRDSLNRNPTLKEIHDWIITANYDSIKQKQNPQYKQIIPPVIFHRTISSPGSYDFTGTGCTIMFYGIGGTFDVTVAHWFDPLPGATVCPGDTQLRTLSGYDYWDIQQFPTVSFSADVCFLFDSTSEGFESIGARLGTRVNQSQCVQSVPGAHFQGPYLCGSTNHFSQYVMASATLTSVDVTYDRRWNLISVPVQVSDLRRNILFPSSQTSAYYYNHGYVSTDTLGYCNGYWLKFSNSPTTTFTGNIVLNDTCPIVKGWNLIGSISGPVPLSNVSAVPGSITLSGFYGYANGYHPVDTLKPGKGYWVKASAAGQIVLTKPPAAVPKSQVRVPDLTKLNSLTLTDANGSNQTLYFGDESAMDNNAELEAPPLPVDGAFDARFASNQVIQLHPASFEKPMDFPIQLASAAYPLNVEWNIVGNSFVSYSLFGKKNLSGKGSLWIKEGPLVLSVQHRGLPKQFALLQNYPNPFNPTTTIGFELPVASNVSLKVYDILGQVVATLIDNKQFDAGEHTAYFDAGTLGSSVYFVRMSVEGVGENGGTFTSIKKMVLIK